MLEVAETSASDETPAYLRQVDENGAPLAFIKIASADCRASFIRDGELAQRLSERSVRVPQQINLTPLEDGTIAVIQSWINGDHPSADNTDFEQLGASVAKFQNELDSLSSDFSVAAKTEDRLNTLLAFAQSDAIQKRWAGDPLQVFAEKATAWFLEFTPQMIAADGPCHGDLNPGNLLIDEQGQFVFLDLEDALHSDQWRGFDLAKIIERIVLPEAAQRGQIWAMTATDALKTGYQRNAQLPSGPDGASALRWHIGMAVQLIAQNLAREDPVAKMEMKKFECIASFITNHEEVLERLTD
ncbi:MAG: hypothetical protein DHS20C06_19580 [Hyphobacterium sp.]|nr:MAG: hypothetical protein DHS20C06_19580 [Hyphobacterium sp.]